MNVRRNPHQQAKIKAPLAKRPQTFAALNLPAHPADHQGMNPPTSDHQLVFTSSQAARYLGVSLATVRRWTDAGYISCYRTPGGQRRFSRQQLDGFIDSLQRPRSANGAHESRVAA